MKQTAFVLTFLTFTLTFSIFPPFHPSPSVLLLVPRSRSSPLPSLARADSCSLSPLTRTRADRPLALALAHPRSPLLCCFLTAAPHTAPPQPSSNTCATRTPAWPPDSPRPPPASPWACRHNWLPTAPTPSLAPLHRRAPPASDLTSTPRTTPTSVGAPSPPQVPSPPLPSCPPWHTSKPPSSGSHSAPPPSFTAWHGPSPGPRCP